ncbi:MAG: TetR/AcrR family transcriptional regulator [Myxococcales bacterium]|nr:TetR/AcrR family transcriptional regulator [Myxococcales bacterium]
MPPIVQTIHRELDAEQTAIRDAILTAARSLIAARGHEPIGMSQIGAAAGVSRSSMYRYFASKEHVVCEAALAWGREVAARLPDAIADARAGTMAAAIELIVAEAASNPPMVRATMASVMGIGATADAFRANVRELFAELMGPAVGALSADMPMSLVLLGRVFFADLSLLSVGDISPEQCAAELRHATRALLADAARRGGRR